mgnify:CR=1 FL=1
MRNISKKIHVINTTNIFIIFKSLNFFPLIIVKLFYYLDILYLPSD